MNRKIVFLFFVILFTGFFIYSFSTESSKYKTISPYESMKFIKKNMNNPDFFILDIRTPKEYKSGHLKKAVLIDYYSESFKKKLAKLDKKKIYLVYCRSANRSTKALPVLEKLKFQNVFNMGSGIKGWVKKKYPVER